MAVEIKVPSVGESVTEGLLAEWFINDGDRVQTDDVLFVLETDKVTLEVQAEADGVLKIQVQAGETIKIGQVVGVIDTEASATEEPQEKVTTAENGPEESKKQSVPEAPTEESKPQTRKPPKEAPAEEKPEPAETPAAPRKDILTPSVKELIVDNGLDADQIRATGPGGRITRGDVLLFLESRRDEVPPKKGSAAAEIEGKSESGEDAPAIKAATTMTAEELTTRKPMSPIRRRIAARLLEAKQNTAMLTTFNEIDMSRVQALRSEFKDLFKQKYDVSLGIMSFFIKATVEALKEMPRLNSMIDDSDIVEHRYYHIGVAVGSERGLVVPVIRHADKLSFAQLEQAIVDFVKKINENRLELSDLEGGTFTISNGGIYGSLLSTPILNMPQSGILGMHKIEKRPVIVDDQVVVRPMMYVALSYDHRIVDGREAVTFLKRIKECVENPERTLMEI